MALYSTIWNKDIEVWDTSLNILMCKKTVPLKPIPKQDVLPTSSNPQTLYL